MARLFPDHFKIALLAMCFLSAIPTDGQSLSPAPDQLGKVYLPTSCPVHLQPLIDRGLALLHSFQYEEAEQTFAEAEKEDPDCAMAHWGMALGLYHQLWDFPDPKTLTAGHEEIRKAQELQPRTLKEQGLLTAAAAFYQKNAELSHAERSKAYSAALGQLRVQIPGDVEIDSFYALSLVALAEEEVDSLANQKRAIAVLNPLFERYPDHPGVAHYLIHAADRPELAREGLAAARRYAAIAPDSPHALHMPSHIFVRLGLWQDSISSNIAADASAARLAGEHKAESHYQTHAMDFLNYSYLQSGQEAKAREVIGHMDHVVGASEENKAEHRAYLSARTAVELHRWTEAAELEDPAIRKDLLDSTRWARAIGNARIGNVREAEAAVARLTESVAERENRARQEGYPVSPGKAADLAEAEAWLLYAQGKTELALGEMGAAVERQEKNGGESVSVPAREMLADLLAELKKPSAALAECKIVLKNAPNRFDALLGAGRAAEATGDTGSAQSFYSKLLELCPAGADRPELSLAKSVLATK